MASSLLFCESLFSEHLLYFVYLLYEQHKCGPTTQDKAMRVKKLVSATWFIRITSISAHLDKINIYNLCSVIFKEICLQLQMLRASGFIVKCLHFTLG